MSQPRSDALLKRLMELHPKVIDLTLDRMHQILPALGNPQDLMPPVIHFAGTNGKGSTQAMVRAGLEGAGSAVHAYTSPHLARFHERIRLAGALISEDALSAILDECVTANGGEHITYFEITTAAAYLAMSRVAADYALIEVGLGGEFDATNIFARPALTVITPVSIDHQHYLGNTLAEITVAKAGIIKRGVPCIVGPQQTKAMEVIEAKAARLGAPLIAQGQHWHVWEERGRLIFQDENGLLDLPLPALRGPHQIDNAGTALATLRTLLADKPITMPAFEAAMRNARWPGRMQRLQSGPLFDAAGPCELWLDGGHNPAGGAAIAATLAGMSTKPTHIICGMLTTKDAGGFLGHLAPQAQSFTAVTLNTEQNMLPAEELAQAASQAGMKATASDSLLAAVSTLSAQQPGCRILICGSLYLVGHILQTNG